MFEMLIVRFGYLAIVAGTFLEGEAILLAAGALAHKGLLSLPLVMLAAFVGSVGGDQCWFLLGRRFGKPFLDKRPKWQARAAAAQRSFDRYGTAFVIGFRFIYGVRTVTPALLGVSQYPVAKFAWFNSLGAAVWAIVVGALGYALGAAFTTILRRALRVEEALAVAIVLAVAAWLLGRRFKNARRVPPG